MQPREFAAKTLELVAAGAGFVGGCCGTTPEHIQALRAAMGKSSAR
jgi:5-methyltetrahydrofolate--homocysteine methyltransferase